jgi:hypothetical protein
MINTLGTLSLIGTTVSKILYFSNEPRSVRHPACVSNTKQWGLVYRNGYSFFATDSGIAQ